ncbi:UNVERIFIED_CONTAM: hypothetical protein PYX00_004123 [Menopon gallinae]|uniref:Structure-specific endonuclease subunit SLX4 n=1 Tax=Menopon gallinae TaxID=328185 RepID=A0AAW2I3Q5_9NEOP
MNNDSDLDDSDFLCIGKSFKRKATDVTNNLDKRLKHDENLGDGDLILDDKKQQVENVTHEVNNSLKSSLAENLVEKNWETDMANTSYQSKLETERHCIDTDETAGGAMVSSLQDYYSCPVCSKMFDSEIAHISHMKQCAKKSKMTAKELLEALELHKKQLKERISLGQSLPLQRKRAKAKSGNFVDSTYDLSLGLALSKSLADEHMNLVETACSTDGSTTLENFGFTNSRNNPVGAVKRKGRIGRSVRSVLRERTKEERERLITEKAGIVLLTTDREMELVNVKVPLEVRLAAKSANGTTANAAHLWELGASSDKTEWYVEGVKSLIIDDDSDVRENSQKIIENQKSDDIQAEITKLNLPKSSVFTDWKKLINNEHLSDLRFRSKEGENIFVHSVVAFARCPRVLDPDAQTVFLKFESKTIHWFLTYLYCGILDELPLSEVERLFELAQDVKYDELVDVLKALRKELNLKRNGEVACEVPVEKPGTNVGDLKIDDSSRDSDVIISSPPIQESQFKDTAKDQSHFEDSSAAAVACLESIGVQDVSVSQESGKVDDQRGVNENEDSDATYCEDLETGALDVDAVPADENVSKGDMFEEEENARDVDSRPGEEQDEDDCVLVWSSAGRVPTPEYDVPEFDPYEHFNNSMPTADPPSDDEPVVSLSVPAGDVSPPRTDSAVRGPAYSSTPIAAISTTSQKDSTPKVSKPKKRKTAIISEKKHESPASKTHYAEGPNREEVSPASSWEESSTEASPAPDYSLMGASTIKKHLTKYGLKRSLSKNKAKKILRHIYEELHPLLNVKSGKIVKFSGSGRGKMRRASSGKVSRRRRSENGEKRRKRLSSAKNSGEGSSRIRETYAADRISEDDPDETEANTSSTADIPSTVTDFIRNNPDIRRQILMYEPIGLEDFRNKLKEKYNKKFKLSNLMDYLDAECIYFRYENRRKSKERSRRTSMRTK